MSLSQHIARRLLTATQTAQSPWAEISSIASVGTRSTASQEVALNYGDQALGVLAYEAGQESFDWARLAGELSPLLWRGACEAAIRLDEEVARLQETHKLWDWVGIYLVGKDDKLYLTNFRGAATPHVIIPVSTGICGAAIRENATLNIPDVGLDPRYLSCDFRTKSEIVVPIRDNSGKAIGEIDIDSHQKNVFTAEDASHLEKLARELTPVVLNYWN